MVKQLPLKQRYMGSIPILTTKTMPRLRDLDRSLRSFEDTLDSYTGCHIKEGEVYVKR